MKSTRLEAYSDAVIAIVITIMVLEIRPPEEASLDALRPLLPTILAYILSFVYLSIYWNNHHHLFQTVEKVNGAVLWANIHWLFWLSLVPFSTSWLSDQAGAAMPSLIYAINLFMAGLAYFIMQMQLKKLHGDQSNFSATLQSSVKERLSLVFYLTAIVASLLNIVTLAYMAFVVVALMWLIPDKRIETQFSK